MSFHFRTKGETLDALTDKIGGARIAPLCHFTVTEWQADRPVLLARLTAHEWSHGAMIVRSSAAAEDTAQESAAGKYLSRAGVCRDRLGAAIDEVVDSYGKGHRSAADRVLVQPMLRDVVASGVAFTRDPSTGAPYLVTNASEGEDTSAVTGGKGESLWCHYHCLHGPEPVDERIGRLLALARELIAFCGLDSLDFEFAFTADGQLWLLQLRPLLLAAPPVNSPAHRERLCAIAHKVAETMRPHPFLHGARTVLGIMPDWNPAEIIGVRPTPLALSLYRELVTDSIWAYQRHNYGYKNLRSFPLLLSLHGLPYIDVRVSFNSFLPRDLDDALAEKLVDYYLDRLLDRPCLHDKVEFAIVFSAYTFDLPQRIEALGEHGFDAEERRTLAEALKRLTNRIINRQTGLWQSDLQKLKVLEERRERILGSGLPPAEQLYWLIEDCKRYGTLPFAGLARAGFIAVQMLRSLVATGVLSEDDLGAFMRGLSTIGSELAHDSAALDLDAFLSKYGHLRPGTYDIRSPRYDEAPELYGITGARHGEQRSGGGFALSLKQMRKIETMLAEHGLETDVVGLFDFLEAAIEGREKAKFIFTRSLSDALALLTRIGAEVGFARDELAHADAGVIRDMQACSEPVADLLARSIAAGRERHAIARTIVLPAVIASSDDVWSFRMLDAEPNFITLGSASGPVRSSADGELAGAVVCIPSADPGFDWIFGQHISALITAFGGANSHMAIRAAELGIPAVIGAGELNFRRWSQARALHVDCANRKVEVLR